MDQSQEQRLDYTRGFGSFYFGSDRVREEAREKFRNRPKQLTAKSRNFPKAKPHSRTTRNNKPHQSFPLMKLPLEVRRQILSNVTDSLASTHVDVFENLMETGIRFHLVDTTVDDDVPCAADTDIRPMTEAPDQRNRDHRTHGSDFTRVDLFDMYKRIRSGEFDDDPRLPYTWRDLRDVRSDYDSESEAEFTDGNSCSSSEDDDSEDGQSAQDIEDEVPADGGDSAGANPPYIVAVSDRAETDTLCDQHYPTERRNLWTQCPCMKRSLSAYRDVVSLSQVSPQITQELGDLMWGSATLLVPSPELFFPFALERPAALACLKSMIVTMECTGYVLDTATSALEAMLEFVSENMELGFLGIRLFLWDGEDKVSVDYETEDSLTAAKLREWAPLFKATKVGKFMVKLETFFQASGMVGDAEKQDAEGQIERMWMPECLALQVDTSDMATYLRNRAV
ncbi:hypothetical protein OQA88_8321 [Cercophora sp. LCS_1]